MESFSWNTTKRCDLIKNSSFFENILSKKDIMESISSKCKKVVIEVSIAAVRFISFPFSDAPILITIQCSMIIAIATQFGNSLNKAEMAYILKNLSKSVVGTTAVSTGRIIGSIIKIILGIGNKAWGTISGSIAAIGTTAIGLADFSYKKFYKYIYEKAKSYNNIIDKFKEFVDLFQKSQDYQYALSPN